MTKMIRIACLSLIALLAVFNSYGYADADLVEYEWGLYMGLHYNEVQDYYQKAGEYFRSEEEAIPEFGIKYKGARDDKLLKVDAFYFDKKRMNIKAEGRNGNLWSANLFYRSIYHQTGQDLMQNLVARESTNREGTAPGGKMIFNEEFNPGAHYGFTRHEIGGGVDFNVPGSANIRLYAAHKSIIEKGEEQVMATTHCSSCHIRSKARRMDEYIHSFKGGVEGDAGPVRLGYELGYRIFESRSETPLFFYDKAQHPVNGGNIEEFGSRVEFDNQYAEVKKLNDTEKISHTVKAEANTPLGRLLGSYTQSTAKNEGVGIEATANGGGVKLISALSSRLFFTGKASLSRIENDAYPIDFSPWRQGRPGGGQDFDYTRYSSLTRDIFNGYGELNYRPSRKLRLVGTFGYETEKRDDYLGYQNEYETTTLFGQAKIRYRFSSKLSTRIKVRYETIDNPFTNLDALLEHEMNGVESPLPGNSLVYYFQRNAYRYGDVTNLPTSSIQTDFSLKFSPSRNSALVGGLKYTQDKNDDLDTFDFERTAMQPSLTASFIPSPKWSFYSAVTYLDEQVNGPFAVALFDG
ncbi:MAG: hypothetical protein GF307_03950 [candidate division Zixibacteria bacterium]|nr:hypothetical protein [candidate division Zixibacteria bacterium]